MSKGEHRLKVTIFVFFISEINNFYQDFSCKFNNSKIFWPRLDKNTWYLGVSELASYDFYVKIKVQNGR